MSTIPQTAPSESRSDAAHFRNVFIGALFALVLLVPKLLQWRHNERSWVLFRTLLAILGAALVVLPIGLGNSYVLALVGMALFIAAILLPPAKPEISVDDKARELGALVVVNGGRFHPEGAKQADVRLFVGSERISVLDSHFTQLLAIPVNEITLAHAEESGSEWLLTVHWAGSAAEFIYRGIFAEHLARVAETTVRSVMHPSLPVIPQSRAASA